MVLTIVFSGCGSNEQALNKPKKTWVIHDTRRPEPVRLEAPERDGDAPPHAVVLFDGRDSSQWVSAKSGAPIKWRVKDGHMFPVGGNIKTKQSFGSCHLHVEWATPEKFNPEKKGQSRGNSGVFLMSHYEIQILDSYQNKTYPDGQAAAVYGQYPPMVNVCRAPGKWQSYDIIFHRPVFKNNKLIKPATVTVLHNGVIVQDNVTLFGPTNAKLRKRYPLDGSYWYKPHHDKLPLVLQDHGNPVKYRNIWLIELDGIESRI